MGLREIQKLKDEAKDKPLPKYGSIKKISDKRAKRLEEQIEVSKKDDEFYAKIWVAGCPCYECGKKLGQKWKRWNFHHCLPKAQYLEYRYEQLNVLTVCLECHSKIETQPDFAPKIMAYTITLKDNLGI